MRRLMRARRGTRAKWLAALLAVAPAHAHQKAPDAPQVVAPGYSALQYEAPQPGTYNLPPLGAAADGDVIDSRGKSTRLHRIYGDGVTLLAFIYTQCDDANGCPLATFVMGQIAKRLQQHADIRARLRLLSYSFDLEHDTPAVLERYAQSFRPAGARWDFVTAPDANILRDTLAAYQQSFQKSGGHTFAHILRVFLIDADHRVRNIYSTAYLHADTVAADIRTLLMEQGESSSAAPPDARLHRARGNPLFGRPPAEGIPASAPTRLNVGLARALFHDARD